MKECTTIDELQRKKAQAENTILHILQQLVGDVDMDVDLRLTKTRSMEREHDRISGVSIDVIV